MSAGTMQAGPAADVSLPRNGWQYAASDLLAAAEACRGSPAHLFALLCSLQQLLPCCCPPSVLKAPGASAVSWVCCLTPSACLMAFLLERNVA